MHAWIRHDDNTWLAMLTILLINIEGTCKTGTTCWRLQNWQEQIEPRVDRDSVQQAAETMCSLRVTGKFCFRTEKKSANIYASACSVDWNSWKPRIFYRSFNRVDLSLYSIASWTSRFHMVCRWFRAWQGLWRTRTLWAYISCKTLWDHRNIRSNRQNNFWPLICLTIYCHFAKELI